MTSKRRIDPTKYTIDRSPYAYRQRKPWRVLTPRGEARWYLHWRDAWQAVTMMRGLHGRHPVYDASLFDHESRDRSFAADLSLKHHTSTEAEWQAFNQREYARRIEHYGWKANQSERK